MTKRGCCVCKELIPELLEAHREQSRLLAAQNEVMGKIMDQNSELMSQLISESENEPDPNRTLD